MSETRSALARDVVAYNVKVWAAGLAAAVFVPLSWIGLVLDVVLGTTGRAALSARVLEASARLEAALDVHGRLTDIRLTADPGSADPGLVAVDPAGGDLVDGDPVRDERASGPAGRLASEAA